MDITKYVLAVDDERSNLLILEKALKQTCHLITTTSPFNAIPLFEKYLPTLVLLDIDMPEMDGFELCEKLKAISAEQSTNFIFITSHDEFDYEQRALQLGAVDFISKPLNIPICQLRINNQLHITRQTQLLKQSHAALAKEREHLRIILRSINDSVIATDEHGFITFMNPAAQRITDWDQQQALGEHISKVMTLTDATTGASLLNPIEHAIHEERAVAMALNTQLISKEGFTYRVEDSASPIITEHGELIGGVIVFQDVSETVEMVTRMTHITQHDQLTGLPNRLLLHDRMIQAISKAKADNEQVATLVIDVDNFMYVNDTLGHQAGDEIINHIAKQLQMIAGNNVTVSRLGGDEFVFMLGAVKSYSTINYIANKILSTIKEPFTIKESEINVTVSIGISIYPQDAYSVEELIRHADTAMYKAKKHGKNCYWYFSEELSDELQDRVAIERELRDVLNRQALILHYQPKFSLKSGDVCGVEALVRIEKSNGQMLAPDLFIPIAEETGLILALGKQVLEISCRVAKQWHIQGNPTSIAVNIAAQQFNQSSFCQSIESLLKKYALPANLLELEITESALIDNFEQAIETINQLKAIGVSVALDDFGTGYSSLSYLKYFKLDVLKIDKSFVDSINSDNTAYSIVSAIVTLASSLALTLVCEGIETQEQLDTLKAMNCQLGQGYYFSRPLPLDQVESFMFERDKH
ncbi:two-component system response regulator [Thalassotalea sediminis]|uniref:two-component system response regulator n=1 Tax=Thalassotalea sediminis TaxID=1759089 RepID=UPI0025735559|nr:EAL domain-containing protein [Thalassotalea sediminis]